MCSESHYSVVFGTDLGDKKKFDLVYYDELARQEDDIILTVRMDKGAEKSKYTVPVTCTLQTKWIGAHVDWNGRDQIL